MTERSAGPSPSGSSEPGLSRPGPRRPVPGITGAPGMAPGPEPARLRCSAKACAADAVYALLWNNPRLHAPERRKVWLACGAHRDHLSRFLDGRDLLRDVIGVDELDETHG